MGSGCDSVEKWLPPTPEIRGLNTVNRQTFIEHLFTVNFVENTKINKKRPGMANFLKNTSLQVTSNTTFR